MIKLAIFSTQILILHHLIWGTAGKRIKSKPPIAVPDKIEVQPKSMSHLNVLDNDSDPNGDELYISEVTTAKNGYLGILDGKKELLYVPDSDFEGVDCKSRVLYFADCLCLLLWMSFNTFLLFRSVQRLSIQSVMHLISAPVRR